jgi:hypothetical protein
MEDPDKNQVELCPAPSNVQAPAVSPQVFAGSDPPFELWLEFEHWLSPADEDPTDEFFTMLISLPNGTKYSLNVWTYKVLESARREAARTGEGLFGRYLEPPDLFVERMDRALLESVVADMVASGRLREGWRVIANHEDI